MLHTYGKLSFDLCCHYSAKASKLNKIIHEMQTNLKRQPLKAGFSNIASTIMGTEDFQFCCYVNQKVNLPLKRTVRINVTVTSCEWR